VDDEMEWTTMARLRTDAADGALEIPLSRRKLLFLGATGAVSIALFRPGGGVQTAEARPAKNPGTQTKPPFAVGLNSGDAFDTIIIDPGGLSSGDPSFTRAGTRLRVLGLCPEGNPAALGAIDWMTVDIGYAPYHDTPFLAWSFRNGPVPQISSPLTITVPVDGSQGLQLIVAYRRIGSAEPVRSTIRFATGTDSGVPKLVDGIYLVALPDSSGSLPDWRKHQLLTEGEDASNEGLCLYEKQQSSLVPSNRPHLMISIS
jgi:hypothetical protein